MTDWDKLYLEINYLALLINRHTHYAVWVNMVGHVDWTEVQIAKSKKEYYSVIVSDQIDRRGIDHEWKGSDIEKLTKIRDGLKHILETGKVDYEAFDKAFFEVWEYVF